MVAKAYTSATDYTKSQDYTPSGDLAVVTPIDLTVTLVGFDGTTYDVTSYTTMASGTRSRANSLTAAQPGSAEVTLRNVDRRFDPGYSSGAYYGNIGLGCEIRVDMTPSGGSAQRVFTGEVQSWDLDWIGPMSSSGTYRGDTTNVRLSCIDRLAKIGNVRTLDNLMWLSIGDGASQRGGGHGSLIAGHQFNVASSTSLDNQPPFFAEGLNPDASLQQTANGRPTWDVHAGTFTQTNASPDYTAVSATNYARATLAISQVTDYAVEGEIRMNKGSGSTNWPGLIVGGPSNTALMVVMGNGTSNLSIQAYYGGILTSLATLTGVSISSGSTYRVRAIVRNRRVTVAVDSGSGWESSGYYDIPLAYWDILVSGESNLVGLFAHNTSSSRFYDFYVHDAGSPIVPRQRSLERAQTLLGLVNPDTGLPVVASSSITVEPSGSRGYVTCPPEQLTGNLLSVLQGLERTEYSRGFFCDRNGDIVLLARYPSAAATAQFTVDWDHTVSGSASYTGLSIGLNWQRYRNMVSVQRYDPSGALTGLPSPTATSTTDGLDPRELALTDIRIDTSTDGDWVSASLARGVLQDTVTDTVDQLFPTSFDVMPGTDSASVATIQTVLSADIGDLVTIDYWPVSGTAQVSHDGWIDQVSWSATPKLAPKFTFRITGPYQTRSGSYAIVGTTTAASWKAAY